MRALVEKHLDSRFAKIVIGLVLFAYVALWGLEQLVQLSPEQAATIARAKDVLNGFFLIELLLRIYAYRGQFFQKMFVVKLPPKKSLRTDETRA